MSEELIGFPEWLRSWQAGLADMRKAVGAWSEEIGFRPVALEPAIEFCARIEMAESPLFVEMLAGADLKTAREFLRLALRVDEAIKAGGAAHWKFCCPKKHCNAPYRLFAAIAKKRDSGYSEEPGRKKLRNRIPRSVYFFEILATPSANFTSRSSILRKITSNATTYLGHVL